MGSIGRGPGRTRRSLALLLVVLALSAEFATSASPDPDVDVVAAVVSDRIRAKRARAADVQNEIEEIADRVEKQLESKRKMSSADRVSLGKSKDKADTDDQPGEQRTVRRSADEEQLDEPLRDEPVKPQRKKSKKSVEVVNLEATPESGNLLTSASSVESRVKEVEWIGPNKQIVLLITSTGRLHRSIDEGKSFEDQTSLLNKLMDKSVSQGPKLVKMVFHPMDPLTVFFTGLGAYNFMTDNGGATYVSSGDVSMTDVKFHPIERSWILGTSLSNGCASGAGNCFLELLYSHSGGREWTHAKSYVAQAAWSPSSARNGDDNNAIIACVRSKQKKGKQTFSSFDADLDFVLTNDYFKTTTTLVKGGNRFLDDSARFLFVASVDKADPDHVRLMVNHDAMTTQSFWPVNIPSLRQRSYTILDSTEGSVFLHVNHDDASDESGSTYVSDGFGVQFSLSLPNNRRDASGTVDFERVKGIEGIYLANYVHHENDKGHVINKWQDDGALDKGTRKRARSRRGSDEGTVRTVISFDKGSSWSYLQVPDADAFGRSIDCTDCYLHLHGPTDEFGPFYSAHNAVGILMATGTIGEHLHDDTIGTATYMSADAGRTWKEVARGSHIYEIGDHGALIVMARDNKPTDTILYTWDQGTNWFSLVISESPMSIDNILIEPEGASQKFLVFASDATQAGKVLHIDFSELHERECEAADYENWSPRDGWEKVEPCMMGHEVSFLRRRPDAACYNPLEYELVQTIAHCQCTESDYECDVGYGRLDMRGDCEQMEDDSGEVFDVGAYCIDGFHRVTKGYRRIPGNTCTGGVQLDAELIGCSTFANSMIHVIFPVMIAIGLLMLAMIGASKSESSCVKRIMERARFGSKYGALDDLDVELDDSDFNNFGSDADFRASLDLCKEPDDPDANDDVPDKPDYSLPPLAALSQRPIPRLRPPPITGATKTTSSESEE